MNVFKVIIYPVAMFYGVSLFMTLFGVAFKGRSLEYYFNLACQFSLPGYIRTGQLTPEKESRPAPGVV